MRGIQGIRGKYLFPLFIITFLYLIIPSWFVLFLVFDKFFPDGLIALAIYISVYIIIVKLYNSFFFVSFICPKCLHSIIFKHIKNVSCGFCQTGGHSKYELFLFCFSCRSIMKYFKCPHCGETIDMLHDYDFNYLEQKRYD